MFWFSWKCTHDRYVTLATATIIQYYKVVILFKMTRKLTLFDQCLYSHTEVFKAVIAKRLNDRSTRETF